MAFFRQFPRTAYVVDGNLINIPDIFRRVCKKDIADFISLPGEVDTIYANAGVGAPDQLSTGDSSYMNKILLTNILGVTNIVLPFITYFKTI